MSQSELKHSFLLGVIARLIILAATVWLVDNTMVEVWHVVVFILLGVNWRLNQLLWQ